MNTSFETDLEAVVNKHSRETEYANTPDFILATYIRDCLDAYKKAVNSRDNWHCHGSISGVQAIQYGTGESR